MTIDLGKLVDDVCVAIQRDMVGAYSNRDLDRMGAHTALSRIDGRVASLRHVVARSVPPPAQSSEVSVLMPTRTPNLTIRLPARMENGVVIINADIEQLRDLLNA